MSPAAQHPHAPIGETPVVSLAVTPTYPSRSGRKCSMRCHWVELSSYLPIPAASTHMYPSNTLYPAAIPDTPGSNTGFFECRFVLGRLAAAGSRLVIDASNYRHKRLAH